MMSGLPMIKRTILGAPLAALPAQNCAMIQLHEQHQAVLAETFLNGAFQFGERACILACGRKLGHVWPTNGCLERLYDGIEGL